MTSKQPVRTAPVPPSPAAGEGPPRAHDAGVSRVGGHPVLDFANTVAWRLDPARAVARVRGAEAWTRWGVAVGLLTVEGAEASSGAADSAPAETSADAPAETAPTETAHAETSATALQDLRAVLWPVLDALVEGEEPPAAAWEALRRDLVRAREDADLLPGFPLRWRPRADGLDGLRHTLALRAEDLLGGDELARVRRCEGPGCGWFFLDRSRGGTRRWCSSGDCGNRDRARRHYARTRQRG
ncbi:CGNR zinc finger domain-containing protein [Streptomyces sp. NPDC056600]|uniref:CGNR zinc finger domain-containing protein n=1 Tax=Streptomyces sp. NPDC056600 TaxID=3345874 RepID=UPI00367E6C9D